MSFKYMSEKAADRFSKYENVLEEKINEAEYDEMKLKWLAFDVPRELPKDLEWYWCGRNVDIMCKVQSDDECSRGLQQGHAELIVLSTALKIDFTA